jgi:hypothetical protein
MGWGHTSFGGQSSNTLLKGDLNIISNNDCSVHYKSSYEIPDGITNDQVCALDESGNNRDTW